MSMRKEDKRKEGMRKADGKKKGRKKEGRWMKEDVKRWKKKK